MFGVLLLFLIDLPPSLLYVVLRLPAVRILALQLTLFAEVEVVLEEHKALPVVGDGAVSQRVSSLLIHIGKRIS